MHEEPMATLEHIKHLKELVVEMFVARDRAMDIARLALNSRLEGMNEFRDALRDQAGHFITREEHTVLTNQINSVQLQTQSAASTYITRPEMEILRSVLDKMEDKINDATARMAALETKIYLGGAGIVVVLTVLQLLLNLWHPWGGVG